MDDTEKAIKAGKDILDGMRFDNLDEQREVINALKRYRKTKAKGKDLTLEQRIILLEIRARAIEPLTDRVRSFRKELILIYLMLLGAFINIMLITMQLRAN